MADLSEALVFYRMQWEPERVRELLRKGGADAVWTDAERTEEAFRRSPSVKDLEERELEMEFFRTWTPSEEPPSRPNPKRLTKVEIAEVMSATENPMPVGLYEALTQA